ncbi:surface antigen BspA-like [Trichomonas vaginalis G3]|uniref:Surface antigen BspA-like n=1 Tax=Trichomonas vaginalis (strain ATCC PRA-98 / G3) TaxID=412133 RepID=A2DNZ2_TRIV3|nr:ribonuclease inhibitor domain-containing protein [Trichomonas vaginalis G3]EAY17841.1 surface antigen BspA-like [Trichomonas vaginalis G3]KAI5489958.1 ribonuclease inhibitor domain-containing protein [Trichomonas vaginalis G3]|eukprot:XP_001329976.1 surface antigen BspA-like [Trichomonas vaginalis G3]
MITFLVLLCIDIDKSCYSSDGKNLTKVNDTSPELRISSTCEIINRRCFYDLNTLFSFSFEENPNLTTIESYSFSSCSNLTIINLSSCTKLTKISSNAFDGCINVNQIILPEGLLEIGDYAFQYIYQLTNIIIPASVKIIGYRSFCMCNELQNVSFPVGSNLTSLTTDVFAGTKITSFQIPEKVSDIDGEAFGSKKFTNISVHPNNNYLILDGNAVYSKNKSILYFICNKTEYEIPNTVTTIGYNCFSYSSIETIIIPNSVTTIEGLCFHDSHIKTIEIPNSITSINELCFYSSYIETVIIPNTTTTIGKGCFSGSIIKTIIIPNTVTTIGEDFLLHCDIKSVIIPNSVTTIGVQSFYGSSLGSIIIPSSVKRIEIGAFEYCNELRNVTFLGPVDYIGEYVFDYCGSLKLIIFPNSTMTVTVSDFVSTNMPNVKLSFTYKTLFYHSQVYVFDSIKRNTKVSISYLNESNLIITQCGLIYGF